MKFNYFNKDGLALSSDSPNMDMLTDESKRLTDSYLKIDDLVEVRYYKMGDKYSVINYITKRDIEIAKNYKPNDSWRKTVLKKNDSKKEETKEKIPDVKIGALEKEILKEMPKDRRIMTQDEMESVLNSLNDPRR